MSDCFYTPTATTIMRNRANGLNYAMVSYGQISLLHATLSFEPGQCSQGPLGQLGDLLKEHKATVVRQEVLGPAGLVGTETANIERIIGPIDWPVSWIDGKPCSGDGLAGMQVLAVTGAHVSRLRSAGTTIGSVFADTQASYCMLGNLCGDDIAAPKDAQAHSVLLQIEQALGQAGMSYANLFRTWFYNDDILGWYGPFNSIRTEFFANRGVFDRLLPASTGIGAANGAGAALVVGATAARPLGKGFTACEVASPLQCSARTYGSSFSRAVELQSPHWRWLTISGTASIEPGGKTIHPGDVRGQIAKTMEVVAAILESRGMTFADTTRAIAYFRDGGDRPLFEEYCRVQKIEALPVVMTECVICRDDLLFEIELDAMSPTSAS